MKKLTKLNDYMGAMLLVAIVLAAIALFYSSTSTLLGNKTASFWNAVQGFQVNGTEVISSSRGSAFTTGTFSSTLGVTGAATLSSTLSVSATTSITGGNLFIGSSTPMSVTEDGFVAINDTGQSTSTLYLVSEHGTRGGCIQLEGASTTFRLYATTTLTPAIWEAGTCR